MIESAQAKWRELCRRFTNKDCDQLFAKLVEHYSESHRAYHNLTHIEDCLREFWPVRQQASSGAVEFAIWFHDVVYDSHAKDNEERSAEFAAIELQRIPVPPDLVRQISELILVTKHQYAPVDLDAALIVDVDLTILGQPLERFDRYEKEIRSEYNWVSDADFAVGRAKVLENFIERATIYTTEFFRGRYEFSARENIQRSLRKWR
jgi:predicted metal-dependent HD superfamily phosphohydrolase